ncbi:hypothetical protein AXF42_Ash006063 [Apostasia shenzhenica]|uniref:Uncharacterized protein n=1 Tax=Apostasia shenzhenica TaxID=1088818 RepID=A0A2I0B053_9ASPA|nr:hypothetical protein AXF42_Ash006063 [Apostasia shenzhenica]
MDLLRAPPEDFLLAAAGGLPWAWIAVLTAAVGLWRIRSVGSRFDAHSSAPFSPPPPNLISSPPLATESPAAQKERFTAYYYSEPAEEGGRWGCIDYGEEEVTGGNDDGGEADKELTAPLVIRSEWEGIWSAWRGDLGWYRHQRRTAINGSVVRLWGGEELRQRM